jgi:hypothetical protein
VKTMRPVVCVSVVIGCLAAIAIPGAHVIVAQRRELDAAREQRHEFCSREANFALSNLSLFNATEDPRYRGQLALDMLHRHELGTILGLCSPGVTVDAKNEQSCWLAKGDPVCLAPYLARLVVALESWRK